MTDDIEWTTHLHDGSGQCPVPGDTLVRFKMEHPGFQAERALWNGAIAYQIGTPRKPEVIEAVGYWGYSNPNNQIRVSRYTSDTHRITVTIEKRGDDYTATSVQMEPLE